LGFNFSDYETSETLELGGAPMDCGGGRTLWVRRLGGRNTQPMLWWAEHYERLCAELDVDKLDRDGEENLELFLAAECLLARWDGVLYEGETVELTRARALELLAACPDLLREVKAFAVDPDNYRDAEPRAGRAS